MASVPRYSARACCTSSSESLPLLNSRSAMSRLRFCRAAFSRAITQPRLQRADRAVQAGHLRGHQHLQVVVLGDAGEVAGVRGLDAAPEPAPEIELPADAQPGAEGHRGGVRRAGAVCSPTPSSSPVTCCTCGYSVLPAIPSWARASMMRRPAVRTLGFDPLRLGDQLVEHGIVEAAPPRLQRHAARDRARSGGQRLERAAFPVGQPGHLGPLEVGPDRRAGAQQRGAGQPQHQRCRTVSWTCPPAGANSTFARCLNNARQLVPELAAQQEQADQQQGFERPAFQEAVDADGAEEGRRIRRDPRHQDSGTSNRSRPSR